MESNNINSINQGKIRNVIPRKSVKSEHIMMNITDSFNRGEPSEDSPIDIRNAAWSLFQKTPIEVAWSYDTEGHVSNPPIAGPDGTVVAVNDKGEVFALDGKNGNKIWKQRIKGEPSTPVMDSSGRIFIGNNNGKIFAYDGKTGKKLWESATSGYGKPTVVPESPTVGADGTVYVGSNDMKVVALDGETGNKKWEFKTDDAIVSPPVAAPNGTVYAGSLNGKVFAIDGKKGDLKWKYQTDGNIMKSSPRVGSDGTLFIMSNKIGNTGKLYALGEKTKKGFWGTKKEGEKLWELEFECIAGCSPALGFDDTLYISDNNSKVRAIDGKTGEEKWSCKTGGALSFSPSVDSCGNVFVSSNNGNTYAIDGKSGGKQWEIKAYNLDKIDINVLSSPCAAPDGTVYVGSKDGNVYALRKPKPPVMPEEDDKRTPGIEKGKGFVDIGGVKLPVRNTKDHWGEE